MAITRAQMARQLEPGLGSSDKRKFDKVTGKADLVKVGIKPQLNVPESSLVSFFTSIKAFSISFKISKEYL